MSNPGDQSRFLDTIAEDDAEMKMALIQDYERRRSTGKFGVMRFNNHSRD